jgi:hypothetical protein
LRDNGDPGYVAIVPLKDRKLCKYKLNQKSGTMNGLQDLSASGFILLFLLEVRSKKLSAIYTMLIGFDTPEIPQAV